MFFFRLSDEDQGVVLFHQNQVGHSQRLFFIWAILSLFRWSNKFKHIIFHHQIISPKSEINRLFLSLGGIHFLPIAQK